MPYGFIQDVPADESIYREVRTRLGEEPPAGLRSHVVVPREEGGLRYIDVWESAADWERFRDEQAEPAVRDALAARGIPFDRSLVRFQEVDVVDSWVGSA